MSLIDNFSEFVL